MRERQTEREIETERGTQRDRDRERNRENESPTFSHSTNCAAFFGAIELKNQTLITINKTSWKTILSEGVQCFYY